MTAELPNVGDVLGRALARYATDATRPAVTQAVRLLTAHRAAGNVCLPFDDLAHDREVDADSLREGLLTSGVCGRDEKAMLPLVLDAEDRLYLRRDFAVERRIATALQSRLAAPAAVPPEVLRDALAARGELPVEPPVGGEVEPDWQLAAIAAAASRRFLLLTGGPGTGKTTTVARLLALLLDLPDEQGITPRIALCAPTGKAAARMAEAIRRHAASDATLQAALPDLEPRTLHRLLGYRALDDSFLFGRDRALPFDVVVVDEASMLDPVLLAELLDALADDARLVLVGDRDQLAAVAAGQVLGDLCRAANADRGPGRALADLVRQTTGMQLPTQDDAPPIADHVIQLRVNHRFGAQPGLDHFARALALRDPRGALAVLDAGHPDLVLATDPDAVLRELEDELLAIVAASADEAVADLGRLRVLAATRHGAGGTLAWNRRIEDLLARHGIRVDDPWYPGRPILVLANDHQNRIFNGDLGVACRDENGRPQVAFPGADGGVRYVSAFRVPEHETAWAMTVHKSQGSEFDTVVLSMPSEDGPLWQAPLLYTGITRARRRALLVAEAELLRAGVTRWPERSSGLYTALR